MRDCEYCDTKLDDADQCPRCNAERDAKMAEMRRGNWRAALSPAGPWKSRDSIIRDYDAD